MAFFFGQGQGQLGFVEGINAGAKAVLSEEEARQKILQLQQEREFRAQLQPLELEAKQASLAAQQVELDTNQLALLERQQTTAERVDASRQGFEAAGAAAAVRTRQSRQQLSEMEEIAALPASLSPLGRATRIAEIQQQRGNFAAASQTLTQGAGLLAAQQLQERAVGEASAFREISAAYTDTSSLPEQVREDTIVERLTAAANSAQSPAEADALRVAAADVRAKRFNFDTVQASVAEKTAEFEADQAVRARVAQNPSAFRYPSSQLFARANELLARGSDATARKYRGEALQAAVQELPSYLAARRLTSLQAVAREALPDVQITAIGPGGGSVTIVGEDGQSQDITADQLRGLLATSSVVGLTAKDAALLAQGQQKIALEQQRVVQGQQRADAFVANTQSQIEVREQGTPAQQTARDFAAAAGKKATPQLTAKPQEAQPVAQPLDEAQQVAAVNKIVQGLRNTPDARSRAQAVQRLKETGVPDEVVQAALSQIAREEASKPKAKTTTFRTPGKF